MSPAAAQERAIREVLSAVTLSDECLVVPRDITLEALGVDSAAMIELLYALEDRFSIQIGEHEVEPEHFASRFLAPSVSQLTLRPSEYFARNVWIGASIMGRSEVQRGVIEVAGDRLMWGNDYPHSEGTFPSTAQFLGETFFDRTVDETRQILGETAFEVYPFEYDAVRAVADRVGPPVGAVNHQAAA